MFPLYVACRHGHTEIARRLLEANANVHVERREGSSALHVAAANGYAECVALLLEANAQVAHWNYLGVGPLFAACTEGAHHGVVKLLLEAKAPVEGSGTLPTKLTPLAGAAMQGHHRSVALLLASGADTGATSIHGLTALDHATRGGHDECISLLEEAHSSSPPGSPGGGSREAVHAQAEKRMLDQDAAHPQALRSSRSSREVASRDGFSRASTRKSVGFAGA